MEWGVCVFIAAHMQRIYWYCLVAWGRLQFNTTFGMSLMRKETRALKLKCFCSVQWEFTSNTLGSDKKCAMDHPVMNNFCNWIKTSIVRRQECLEFWNWRSNSHSLETQNSWVVQLPALQTSHWRDHWTSFLSGVVHQH